MGDGSTSDNAIPTEIDGSAIGNPWRYVAAGHTEVTGPDYHDHVCAITTDGDAYCWGTNTDGELGNGDNTQYSTPAVAGSKMALHQTIRQLDLRTHRRRRDILLGRNHAGLGHGHAGTSDTNQPTTAVVDPSGGAVTWAKIYVASWSTCAITDAGATYCWGEGDASLIPGATDTYTPTLVSGITLRDAAGNENNVCGITITNDLKCWGDNANGTFGDGSTADSSTPVQIMSDVAQVYEEPAPSKTTAQPTAGVKEALMLPSVGYVYSDDVRDPLWCSVRSG